MSEIFGIGVYTLYEIYLIKEKSNIQKGQQGLKVACPFWLRLQKNFCTL